ncbi:MAG: YdeI/OmpD-associated family protein [Phycisphaerae bacterium]|nr:YdeI/OmpD-associated family protein [Phycisphaerae bacterium]
MRTIDRLERVEITSRAEWRRWLAVRHDRPEGVWVVSYKKTSGGPYVGYDALVEEALCYGWIDSLPRRLDEKRTMLLFTPRRPGSEWSRLNKQRIERLLAEGLIEPPGMEKIERAKKDGSWSRLDPRETAKMPRDLSAALRANPLAKRHFDAFSPGVRKGIIWWVLTAKQQTTRLRRIAETVRLAAENRKANHPEDRAEGPRTPRKTTPK